VITIQAEAEEARRDLAKIFTPIELPLDQLHVLCRNVESKQQTANSDGASDASFRVVASIPLVPLVRADNIARVLKGEVYQAGAAPANARALLDKRGKASGRDPHAKYRSGTETRFIHRVAWSYWLSIGRVTLGLTKIDQSVHGL